MSVRIFVLCMYYIRTFILLSMFANSKQKINFFSTFYQVFLNPVDNLLRLSKLLLRKWNKKKIVDNKNNDKYRCNKTTVLQIAINLSSSTSKKITHKKEEKNFWNTCKSIVKRKFGERNFCQARSNNRWNTANMSKFGNNKSLPHMSMEQLFKFFYFIPRFA